MENDAKQNSARMPINSADDKEPLKSSTCDSKTCDSKGFISKEDAYDRIERCCKNDQGYRLLERIEQLLRTRLEDEESRQNTIEQKAARLQAIVGICVSIVLTIGVKGIGHECLWAWLRTVALILFGFSFVAGIITVILAASVLRIRGYCSTNDEIILNKEIIDYSANGKHDSVIHITHGKVVAKNSWENADKARKINDQKVNTLKWAQRFFVYFVIMISFAGILIAFNVNMTTPSTSSNDVVVQKKQEGKKTMSKKPNSNPPPKQDNPPDAPTVPQPPASPFKKHDPKSDPITRVPTTDPNKSK